MIGASSSASRRSRRLLELVRDRLEVARLEVLHQLLVLVRGAVVDRVDRVEDDGGRRDLRRDRRAEEHRDRVLHRGVERVHHRDADGVARRPERAAPAPASRSGWGSSRRGRPGRVSGSMRSRKGRSSWIASARSTSSSETAFSRTRISPSRVPACSPRWSASASSSRSGESFTVSREDLAEGAAAEERRRVRDERGALARLGRGERDDLGLGFVCMVGSGETAGEPSRSSLRGAPGAAPPAGRGLRGGAAPRPGGAAGGAAGRWRRGRWRGGGSAGRGTSG